MVDAARVIFPDALVLPQATEVLHRKHGWGAFPGATALEIFTWVEEAAFIKGITFKGSVILKGSWTFFYLLLLL